MKSSDVLKRKLCSYEILEGKKNEFLASCVRKMPDPKTKTHRWKHSSKDAWKIIQDSFKTSWWLSHPFEKICSSNWIISPSRGEHKKCFKPPRKALTLNDFIAFPKPSDQKLPSFDQGAEEYLSEMFAICLEKFPVFHPHSRFLTSINWAQALEKNWNSGYSGSEILKAT